MSESHEADTDKMPDDEQLQKPSTEKEADEEPKNSDSTAEEVDHEAVGIGIVGHASVDDDADDEALRSAANAERSDAPDE
ncbi:MAG: hypothetical protein FWD85_07555 [Microbacteriaceae bacterium]|nr:hypothetical protein [Microbacteriaceae bacterium]